MLSRKFGGFAEARKLGAERSRASRDDDLRGAGNIECLKEVDGQIRLRAKEEAFAVPQRTQTKKTI